MEEFLEQHRTPGQVQHLHIYEEIDVLNQDRNLIIAIVEPPKVL